MEDNIEILGRDLIAAKKMENAAVEHRRVLEKRIVAILGARDDGSKTHHFDGLKLTITQPVTRSIDVDTWNKVKHHCPPLMSPVKIKLEVDTSLVKLLTLNEPQIWGKIASAFTTKPGKIMIKAEETI